EVRSKDAHRAAARHEAVRPAGAAGSHRGAATERLEGVVADRVAATVNRHWCNLKRPLINARVPLRAPVTLCNCSSFAHTTQLRPRFLARYNAWSACRNTSSKP